MERLYSWVVLLFTFLSKLLNDNFKRVKYVFYRKVQNLINGVVQRCKMRCKKGSDLTALLINCRLAAKRFENIYAKSDEKL